MEDATGISSQELQKAQQNMSTEDFKNTISHCIEAKSNYSSTPQTFGGEDTFAPLPDGVWANFRSSLLNGSVIITKDNMTLGFQHGHSAIISGASNMSASNPLDRSFYFTEHPGAGELSWRKSLHNTTTLWWHKRATLASYDFAVGSNTITDVMTKASKVATTNAVLNKPYAALATKIDKSKYNCATIVWRCFIDASGKAN